MKDQWQVTMKIGFIGLGKLGAPYAQMLARSHDVLGYDVAPREIAGVRIVGDIAEVVHDRELVLIAVPTPHHQEYGGERPTSHLAPTDFNYSILCDILAAICPHVAPSQCVSIVSTVLPGTCRALLAPILPQANLLYTPSFIAMGSVESDLQDPDLLPVGTQDGRQQGAEAMLAIHPKHAAERRHVGTWEEMEAIKVFYNTYIGLKLTFANMVQDVAQKLGHANCDRITGALAAATKRLISPAYLRGGMGDGGPCHPRDNIALRDLSARLELGYDLFADVLHCREQQAKNLAAFAVSFARPVVIVGMSYKPGVALVDGSSALLVGHYVAQLGELSGYIDDLIACRHEEGSNTYLLAHDYNALRDPRFPTGSIIVDPWRTCPDIDGCEIMRYGDTRKAPT